MRLQGKLLLACGVVLLLTLTVNSLITYREVKAHTQQELAKEAGNIRAMLMATRRIYHQQFVDSGLPVTDKYVGFLPAHALHRISRDFSNWTNSGLYFNNVSDRPRNPANQADAFELEAMAWFRANSEARERITEITEADGQRYYHYTAPLPVETYCLKCHGQRTDAPPSIASRYGEAYDYQPGDLRGVMSIKIPTAPSEAHVWSVWRTNLVTSVAALATLFLCLGLLINRLVTRRLLDLKETASALAAGNYTQRTAHGDSLHGSDEVSSLAITIDRMAGAVQKRDSELQRFAEVTAHHLQEPARRLVSYADRLSRQLAGRLDDPEAQMSLVFIGQQARRQQSLLRDIERYLAADQPRGQIITADAGKVLARVLKGLAGRIAEAGAVVATGDLPGAWIDAPRLADLFEVALDNALKFGISDDRRISVDGQRMGTQVRYRVSDNGPGIEEEYRERVFRVFERLIAGGDADSTGIGLSIMRRIAESCGGRAWIEETPGGGCSVLFEIAAEAGS